MSERSDHLADLILALIEAVHTANDALKTTTMDEMKELLATMPLANDPGPQVRFPNAPKSGQ